jgi:elongation factor 1 alpha-like protein
MFELQRLSGRRGHDSCNPIGADRHQDLPAYDPCTSHFSAVEFFKDCPWLNIPEHRKAEITIEPLHSQRGLLGGAPEKMSKLAALAAKRRQREIPRPASEEEPGAAESYVPRLKRLAITSTSKGSPDSDSGVEPAADGPSSLRGDSTVTEESKRTAEAPDPEDTSSTSIVASPELRAQPSAFASIMTSRILEDQVSLSSHTLPSQSAIVPFNFAEPSPDDVVTRAQSAKGRA